MGVCQNHGRKNNSIITIKGMNKTNNPNIIQGRINQNKLKISKNYNIQYSNFPASFQEDNPQEKILSPPGQKYSKTSSNLSSNSTNVCVATPPSPMNFNIIATIGEVEIPIYVEKDENIIIKINENNTNTQNFWSFLPKEKPIDFSGYPNYKYKDKNVGTLLFRITGSRTIYHINKQINSFKASAKGSLLFWANLDPNDYQIYEPKGSIEINITGGNHFFETELSTPYDINNIYKENNNYNNIIIKDILKYINKARDNILKFYKDYFYINDINHINKELEDFINKNNFKRKELVYDKELNMLAEEHCNYLCINNTNGEFDKNGFNIKDKIKNKLNIFFERVNFIYGINNPLLIVKSMFEAKYSKLRKNRINLLFHQMKRVGISLKEHKAYKFCCVIAFSE